MNSNFARLISSTRAYPITDRELSGLSHAEQVARLADAGATIIQLRDKLAHPRDFYEAAREALDVARARNLKLIINDRVDIALALKADGVHLGQDDLPPSAARSILGADAIIGFSTHSVDQAARALNLPIDYIAIGPIFATTTKLSSNVPVGLSGLAQVRALGEEWPLVAIGGITAENLQAVVAAGADGGAFISDIWHRNRVLNPKLSQILRS